MKSEWGIVFLQSIRGLSQSFNNGRMGRGYIWWDYRFSRGEGRFFFINQKEIMMKGIRVSLVLLVILSLLLLTFSTASAKVTRIYFYQVGGDECSAELEPPLISGPNMHLHGTYACPTVAYTMDGDPFPMFTGIIYWTDAHAQIVDGHGITTAKLRMETDEGGVWEGSFSWPATGVLKGVYQGQGIYQGMTVYGTYDPVKGFNGGYVQFNSNK